METELIVTITKKNSIIRPSRQKIRFRIESAGNYKTLAVSNDAYANEVDAVKAVKQVIGYEYRPAGTVRFVREGFDY